MRGIELKYLVLDQIPLIIFSLALSHDGSLGVLENWKVAWNERVLLEGVGEERVWKAAETKRKTGGRKMPADKPHYQEVQAGEG